MSFHKLVEDPMYDDDGQLVDEDADWEDLDLVEEEDFYKKEAAYYRS